MPTPRPTPDRDDAVETILDRPREQRLREYKYRFAQSLVFGLPVIALAMFADRLGGRDAERWSGFLQFLLASWVLYVGAAGMLFEGLFLLRRGLVTLDLLVSATVAILYAAGVASLVHVMVTGRVWLSPLVFAWAVGLAIAWSGFQWGRHAGRT